MLGRFHRFRQFRRIAMLLGAGVLFVSSASAAVIANYPFDTGNASTNAASTDTDPNSAAADFLSGNFTGGAKSGTTVGISTSSFTAFIRSSASPDTTESAAASNDDSWGFTVTPTSGGTISLTSLDFQHGNNSQANGTNFTSNFVVRSSLDNFATDLGTGVYSKTTASTTASFSSASIDLTAPAFQNLTTPITFKFFEFDASTNSGDIARMDNVVLNGTSTPEPSGIFVLATGATALLSRRRSR